MLDERRGDAAGSAVAPEAAPSLRNLRRRLTQAVVYLAVFVGLLVPTVYWVEAEKEAHILCGMARLGVPEADVRRLFGTATLLRVETERRGGTHELRARTPAPIGHERCVIAMRDGVVASVGTTRRLPTLTVATLILYLGVPLAWLVRLRRGATASVIAALGGVLLILAALQRSGAPSLAVLADASSLVLAVALVSHVALAVRRVASAPATGHWRGITASTGIALACSILLLAPPTP